MPEYTSETRSAWRTLLDAVEGIGDVMATPRGAAPDRALRIASLRSEKR
ncbi:MAG TPA: hypothetical protein VFD50_07995 [Thermoleophilia bacterium]|nr:hypothetical protein [Thermoleophilia bacterium]